MTCETKRGHWRVRTGSKPEMAYLFVRDSAPFLRAQLSPSPSFALGLFITVAVGISSSTIHYNYDTATCPIRPLLLIETLSWRGKRGGTTIHSKAAKVESQPDSGIASMNRPPNPSPAFYFQL